MTNEEKELIVYCLKANSDFHREVCEECKNFPKCDHFQADSLMEKLIKALEQEPFINKPCVSSGVCEHDKNKVLEEIKKEIKALKRAYPINYVSADDAVDTCIKIIDRHIGKETE